MTRVVPTASEQTTQSTGAANRCLQIACCADEAYAMGLAVTLRSAARQLDSSCKLNVHLVDAGMTSATRDRLIETCVTAGIVIETHVVDLERLSHLPISHHISHAAYIRLLLADVLPSNVDRVLYLDSDLLIKDDLSKLYETPLDGNWCAAVPDIACPVIDAKQALKNVRQSGPYMATLLPVPNYEELGLAAGSPYFNSGVLLIDLDQWRKHNLSSQFLDCLGAHRDHIWCWDQYALNVVLHGHWKPLPLRWNCGGHLYEYPSMSSSPVPEIEWQSAMEEPAIVHFTTKSKPWHGDHQHPHRDEFYVELDETQWSGWRPDPIRPSIGRWWSRLCEQGQQQVVIGWRKWQLRKVTHEGDRS